MNTERNATIAARCRRGETLQAVANDYGITRERVRQIARQHGTTAQEQRAARLVAWECLGCGKQERRIASLVRRFCCNRECHKVWVRRVRPITPETCSRGADGHWWTTDPFLPRPSTNCRAERAIAQRTLGRRLERNEWVALADGNPDNLDPSNILLLDPQALAFIRSGRAALTDCAHRSLTQIVANALDDYLTMPEVQEAA